MTDKLVLKAIKTRWRLYYLIICARIVWPFTILTEFLFDQNNPDHQSYMIITGIVSLIILVFGVFVEPYSVIDKAVVSRTKIFYQGVSCEYFNMDKLYYSLSKPYSGSLIQQILSVRKAGFGSWIKWEYQEKTVLLKFLLEDSKQKTRLLEILSSLRVDVTEVPFSVPRFPIWKEFKEKDLNKYA